MIRWSHKLVDRMMPPVTTGAGYLRNKARLKARRLQNKVWQRQMRAKRDRREECRTCGRPAVLSERTGLLTRQCARHLALDVARKEVYLLPWQSLEDKRRGKFSLEYVLSGALP